MAYRIVLRRDTSTNWTTNNPVLLLGEPGYETDTNSVKIGDGELKWNDLPYTIQDTKFTKTAQIFINPIGYGGSVSKRNFMTLGGKYEIPAYGPILDFEITNGFTKYKENQGFVLYSIDKYQLITIFGEITGVDNGDIITLELSNESTNSAELETTFRIVYITGIKKPVIDKQLIFTENIVDLYDYQIGDKIAINYTSEYNRNIFILELTISDLVVNIIDPEYTEVYITTEESTEELIYFFNTYKVQENGPDFAVFLGDATIKILEVDLSAYDDIDVTPIAETISGTPNQIGYKFIAIEDPEFPLPERSSGGYPAIVVLESGDLLKIPETSIQIAKNLPNYYRYNKDDYEYLDFEEVSVNPLTYKISIETPNEMSSVDIQSWSLEVGSSGKFLKNMNNCIVYNSNIVPTNSNTYSFVVRGTSEDLGGGLKNGLPWRGWIDNVEKNSFDIYIECSRNDFNLISFPFFLQLTIQG